ncbi:Chitin deacetylase [Lachnellula willkommii]|uniref:Chitin deacetylase n=1 Tax=Lachnellula willkommii TaxID=215461 RepID=A0A559MFJ6_9HELO|nr:Chitin deacetylase [Lachnellula willkommii]
MPAPYDLPTDTSTIKEFEWDDHYDFARDLVGYGENSFDPKWLGGAKIAVSFNYNYTLYAVGKAIEDNPAVGISSMESGHDVASHAYRWIDYANMPRSKKRHIFRRRLRLLQRSEGSHRRAGIMADYQVDPRHYSGKFTNKWVYHCFGTAIHTQMICLIRLTFQPRKTRKIPREC